MKRALVLLALTTALAGCQSVQRELFGPPTQGRAATAPVQSAPASPPSGQPAYSQPSSFGQPSYGQPVYTQPAYTQPSYAQPASTASASLIGPPMDAGQRALLDADRRFSELVVANGLASAVASVADREGATLITTATSGTLNIIPEKATLASSMDFGQTSGRYVQVTAAGAAVQGRYVTVWRKDSGNNWRVLSYASMVAAPRTAAAAAARRR